MLSIGKVAKASGCKVQTIRYYEQIGLIREAMRSDGNQRFYTQSDVERLIFIRHARALGFSTEAIKSLLKLNNYKEMSCAEVDAIARHQYSLIQQRIQQLQSLADELSSMIGQCNSDNIASCKILESLHEPSHLDSQKTLTFENDLKP